MLNGNPDAATNAITAQGERVNEIYLTELTFAKAALLERIKSPYATGAHVDASAQLNDLMRAIFILAHPAQKTGELIAANAFQAAVDSWGDMIRMDELPLFADAIGRIFKRVEDVTPRGAATEKKPQATTAG